MWYPSACKCRDFVDFVHVTPLTGDTHLFIFPLPNPINSPLTTFVSVIWIPPTPCSLVLGHYSLLSARETNRYSGLAYLEVLCKFIYDVHR